MPAPPRVTRRAATPDDTHAAEVVMRGWPAAHLPALRLESSEPVLVDTGLGVHDPSGRMEARARDGRHRIETLVEDRGRDTDERSP